MKFIFVAFVFIVVPFLFLFFYSNNDKECINNKIGSTFDIGTSCK